MGLDKRRDERLRIYRAYKSISNGFVIFVLQNKEFVKS
jgi:hypothetical protein